jgi:hypothetical protein
MDIDHFTATMRAFRNRVPFRPFKESLINGDRYEVDHPEAVAIRKGLALFAAPGNVPVIFDYDGVSQIIDDLSEQESPTL